MYTNIQCIDRGLVKLVAVVIPKAQSLRERQKLYAGGHRPVTTDRKKGFC